MQNKGSCVGDYIRCQHKTAGLTQDCLARQIGVTRVALNRWEQGRTIPRYRNCMMLSLELKLDCLDLLQPLYPDKARWVRQARRLVALR